MPSEAMAIGALINMNKINSTRANPAKERGVALVPRFHCRSILFHLCGGLHSSALLYVVANVCVCMEMCLVRTTQNDMTLKLNFKN